MREADRRRHDRGMRLAILGTRGIPARYGGFETFAEELSVRLVQRGVEVTVYCEGSGGVRPQMYRGVRLVHLPAPSLGPLSTIVFDLLCLWHARKAYDVVYMLGYGASLFCFLPRLWGSEVWINMDGIEWARSKWNLVARSWFRIMEALAMWTPDRVIADSRGILRHLKERHRRVPAPCVISYGAPLVLSSDPAHLAPWGLAPGGYYLVLCRLEPENSIKEIIRGHLASGSLLPLVIVGRIEPATDYVRELLALAGEKVRFIGPVYHKERVQSLRHHAFAYLHGHTVGGTNPSLLEALGCGSLVIARDNVFNREVADAAALYFGGVEEIASAIREVEGWPVQEVNRLKALARERITKEYSWERIAQSYYRLATGRLPLAGGRVVVREPAPGASGRPVFPVPAQVALPAPSRRAKEVAGGGP